MKVFLSWSGDRSKEVANLLSDWLSCVIQAVRPWISTRDIDRGALWFSEIGNQLNDTVVGIVCLTQENKDKPWILFEAGALAKGLTTSRVCTFLIDLEPKDIRDPLAQFNHTMPDRDGVYALVATLNSALGVAGLSSKVLDDVFDTYWPQFEKSFALAVQETESPGPVKPREQDDVLSEILENTRTLSLKIRKLESDVSRGRVFGSGAFGFASSRPANNKTRVLNKDDYEEVLRKSTINLRDIIAQAGLNVDDVSESNDQTDGSVK